MNSKTEYLTREQVIAKLIEAQGGDTQAALAAKIGLKAPFLNNILKGHRDPDARVLEFLSNKKDELVAEVVYKYQRRKP